MNSLVYKKTGKLPPLKEVMEIFRISETNYRRLVKYIHEHLN